MTPKKEEGILLSGGTDEESGEETPDLFLTHPGTVGSLKDTNLADGHLPKRLLRAELEKWGEDLGDGFILHHTPVRIERDIEGNIVRTTSLNELPGVKYTPAEMEKLTMLAEEKPVIRTLNREERSKLLDIMVFKLMKMYANPVKLADLTKYNPLRDGLLNAPAGSPEFLQPLPGTPFYPASPGQVAEWLKGHIGPRISVIEKTRFGEGYKEDIANLAIRIE